VETCSSCRRAARACCASTAPTSPSTRSRVSRPTSANSASPPTTRLSARSRRAAKSNTVGRSRRDLRRGGALRGAERPGLDQHAAAPLPRRFLASGSTNRHARARRRRRPGGRQQAPRDSGFRGLLRVRRQLATVINRAQIARLRTTSLAGTLLVLLWSPAANAAVAARHAPSGRPDREIVLRRQGSPAATRGFEKANQATRMGEGRPAVPGDRRALPSERLLRRRAVACCRPLPHRGRAVPQSARPNRVRP